MPENKLPLIRDNQDKRDNYARQVRRYQRAVREGFYLEALVIDCAMLEDRLRAALFHMGLVEDREAEKLRASIKPFVKQTAGETGVKNISCVIRMIKGVLLWAAETDGDYEHDRYLTALKAQCESADVDVYVESLDEAADWLKSRNDVIHALMRRSPDGMEARLKDIAEIGRRLANEMDTLVRLIKRGGRARRAAGL